MQFRAKITQAAVRDVREQPEINDATNANNAYQFNQWKQLQ